MRKIYSTLIFPLLLFFLFLSFPVPSFAKSYSIVSDKYVININPDKSADVVEYLTYNFDGSFSWAEMWIPTKVTRQGYMTDAKITDFNVQSINQKPVYLDQTKTENNRFYAKWSYTAYNEKRTFLIRYKIENAIKKYPEIAEFYWQIIGNEWKIPHQDVEILVRLPESAAAPEDLLVYGHGPLNGISEIVDLQTVRFKASSVSAGQFMEIRTIFPASFIFGEIDGNKTVQEIKKEEENFVRETIFAAGKEQIIMLVTKYWLVIQILTFIIWAVAWFFTWKKYGKEYDVGNLPKHVFDLPSLLPPAEVSILMGQDTDPNTNAFTATIFDLAQKGYIQIRDEVRLKSGFFRPKQEIKTFL